MAAVWSELHLVWFVIRIHDFYWYLIDKLYVLEDLYILSRGVPDFMVWVMWHCYHGCEFTWWCIFSCDSCFVLMNFWLAQKIKIFQKSYFVLLVSMETVFYFSFCRLFNVSDIINPFSAWHMLPALCCLLPGNFLEMTALTNFPNECTWHIGKYVEHCTDGYTVLLVMKESRFTLSFKTCQRRELF